MEKREQEVRTFQGGFVPFLILLGVTTFPIALQPDFGAVLVIGMIAVCMFFIAGGNLTHIFGGGMIITFLLSLTFLTATCNENQRDKLCYIKERFEAFSNPNVESNYQVQQSLITTGSGELWGVGIGRSRQSWGHLPEAQSDTIFAVAAEELGFFRVILLILLFAIISWRGFRIAERAEDRFSKLVATGITAWIVFQALINIYVTLSLFPVTGINLPFISYGGTSLLTLVFISGILLQISLTQNEETYFYNRRRLRGTHHTRTRGL